MDEGRSRAESLQIVRLGLADIDDCIRLVQAAFEQFEHNGAELRQWFAARVIGNPWQAAIDGIGVGARHGGRLVACRAMFAQPWWLDGRETVVAFAAHTSIDPAWRGVGLGSRLIAASRDCAPVTGSTTAGDITQKTYRKQAFHAVGGDGNDFFRLRVSYAGSMASRVGAAMGLPLGRLADALLGGATRGLRGRHGFALEPVQRCSAEFDELWARVRSTETSCLLRSSQYLNWRLFDQPTHPLALLALRDSAGRLRACGVWHELRYAPQVTCAVLRDLVVPADDTSALNAFLREAILHWRRCGVSWANLELAAPVLTRRFAELGYERLPSIGNRYHVHASPALAPATLAGWFRSGLDGDYFDTGAPASVPAANAIL